MHNTYGTRRERAGEGERERGCERERERERRGGVDGLSVFNRTRTIVNLKLQYYVFIKGFSPLFHYNWRTRNTKYAIRPVIMREWLLCADLLCTAYPSALKHVLTCHTSCSNRKGTSCYWGEIFSHLSCCSGKVTWSFILFLNNGTYFRFTWFTRQITMKDKWKQL